MLRQAGIAHRVFEAGGYVVGQVTGLGVGLGGEIWVVHADSERVIEALESEGIAVPLPIVDVSEPVCPACGNDLDRNESESCPACGLLFRWVDVTDWETS